MKDVEELRKEGASRMRALGMMKKVAREFEKSGTLYYSEKVGFPGVLYWASNDEWLERKVGEFEKEFGVSVYHVVLTNCEFGRVYSFLYVGDEEDGGDWEAERDRGRLLVFHEPCGVRQRVLGIGRASWLMLRNSRRGFVPQQWNSGTWNWIWAACPRSTRWSSSLTTCGESFATPMA